MLAEIGPMATRILPRRPKPRPCFGVWPRARPPVRHAFSTRSFRRQSYQPNRKEDEVILEPAAGRADAGVIWLHGLGADGYDFVPLIPELKLPSTRACASCSRMPRCGR